MKYNELDLRKIRMSMNLDFAHYTYKPGMCSCCYGPKDLSSIYWKDEIIQVEKEYDDIEYILFKNADNGSGCVEGDDTIDNDYIEWNFPLEKLDGVCNMLQEQLGDDYIVEKPESIAKCICIKSKYRK